VNGSTLHLGSVMNGRTLHLQVWWMVVHYI
jgi:hypothetical protein